MLNVQGQRYLSAGDIPGLGGNFHMAAYPYGTCEASDGQLNVGAPTQDLWERLCGVLGIVGRAVAMADHRLQVSTTLHARVVDSVLRAPIAFHDVTPVGRVLNRFSSDMSNSTMYERKKTSPMSRPCMPSGDGCTHVWSVSARYQLSKGISHVFCPIDIQKLRCFFQCLAKSSQGTLLSCPCI